MQIGLFSWFLTAILLFLTVIVTIDFFMAWEEKKAASRAKRGDRRPGTAAPVSKLDTKADEDGADRAARPCERERKSEGGPSGRPAPTGADCGRTVLSATTGADHRRTGSSAATGAEHRRTGSSAATGADCGRTGSSATTGAEDGPSGRPAPTGAEGSRRDAGIDLMGAPRPTFRVTLPVDGKVLHLRMPTKTVADRFADIGDRMERFAAGAQTEDDVDALCDFAAVLLTNCTENQSGADFPASAVKNRMTLDDVVIFVTAYMEWMTEVLTSKN